MSELEGTLADQLKDQDQLVKKPEQESGLDSMDNVEQSKPGENAQKNIPQKYVAYTVKLPADQLSALQSIWLELKKLYGSHSPDKSGMIEAAIGAWLKKWDGQDREELLEELLQIRENTRKRQYRKKRD